MQIATEDKIAYFHLWPHARPWRLANPEPMMRCIPDAKQVATLLTEAWMTSTGLSKLEAQDLAVEEVGAQTA
jgi:hypothetical protein